MSVCVVIQLNNSFLNYNLIVMYISFLVGVLLRKKLGNSLQIPWLFIAFLCFSFIFFIYGWNAAFWSIPSVYSEPIDDFVIEYSYKVGYRVCIGVVGALFTIFLFSKLFFNIGNIGNSKRRSPQWLASVGRDTLALYCSHSLLLEVFLFRFKIGKWFSEYEFDYVVAPILTFCMIIFLQFLIRMMERHKLLRYYFLGKS